MRVAEIPFAELYPQMEPLLPLHWDEIALNKHLMVLKPQLEVYEANAANGRLLCIGAWNSEGALVGYSLTMVLPHPHYADLIVAQNDLLFLLPEHRKTGQGGALIVLTEHLAAVRGARLMLWHAKKGTDLDIALSRAGYPVQDIIYSKEL